MKKIFLFVLSFICLNSFGQYVNNPSPYANENTLSRYWGGFRSRLINRPFSDTTQANTVPIKFYDGAQIWTTTDNNFWLRDSANNVWVRYAPFSSVTVTGANNGDTVVAGLVGDGGNLVRNTFDLNTNNFDWRIQNIKKIGINQTTPIAGIDLLGNGVRDYLQVDSNGAVFANETTATASTDSFVAPGFVQTVRSFRQSNSSSNLVKFRTDVVGSSTFSSGEGIWRLRTTYNGSPYFDVLRIRNDGVILDNLNLNGHQIGTAETGTGQTNIKFGQNSLGTGVVTGSNMVGIGINALRTNSSGTENTALGADALRLNTTGNYNTALGAFTLSTNTAAIYNTAVGSSALNANTSGFANTAVGKNSFLFNTAGEKNTGLGAGSGEANTTGSNNTYIGEDAGLQGTTGGENVGVGWLGWSQNRTGIRNVGVGSNSGQTVVNGNYNTAVGYSSMNVAGQEDTVRHSIAIGANTFTTKSYQMVLGNDSLTETKVYGITNAPGTKPLRYDPTTKIVTYGNDTASSGATPNLQTVFAVESNSAVMTANANEIKLNPAGSSGVAKTFSLGATSFADDARMLITNDGVGNGSFDVWAQDSANNNQVFMRSDLTNKRVYLHSARAAASANNLFVYSDSTVFQFTAGTADYRFKGITDLLYPDTTLNKPATMDAQGRLKRLAYWPSGGGGAGTVTNVATGYGLSGGPITTTGTLLLDSANIKADSTKAGLVSAQIQFIRGPKHFLNNAVGNVPVNIYGFPGQTANLFEVYKLPGTKTIAFTTYGSIKGSLDGASLENTNNYWEFGNIAASGQRGLIVRSISSDPLFAVGCGTPEGMRFDNLQGIGWSSGSVSAAGSDILIQRNATRQMKIETRGNTATNTILYPLMLKNLTSSTAAVGYGVGEEFGIENASGTEKTVGRTDYVFTDATNATEDVDYVLSLMDAGTLTEALRVDSDGKPIFRTTITAGGTTGNQTINKATGTVNVAAAGTTVTVTNSLCTTSSIVFAMVRTNDSTCYIKNVVPGAGSFVINLGAAATAEVSIGFLVIN